MGTVRGCNIPEDLYYNVENNVWARKEDDGTVTISGTDAEKIADARQRIEKMTEEPEVGRIYTGTVRTIKDFGAFVEILPGQDGLLHISEIADDYVSKVTDYLKRGDEVTVKCIDIDDNGKIRLSRKAALQETGQKEPS